MTDTAPDMTDSYRQWNEQRELAAQIRALVKRYAESKYEEYRWTRWCSHEPSYDIANELSAIVTGAAISDAMHGIQMAELDRVGKP